MNISQIINIMGWPFVIIYILLLIGLAYFILVSIPKVLSTKKWPHTHGKITESKLLSKKRVGSGPSKITEYSTKVEYTYSVLGEEFRSSGTKLVNHQSTNKASHKKLLNKYPVGAAVKVFYKKDKPQISVLETGFSFGNLLVGMVFLLAISTMTFDLYSKIT